MGVRKESTAALFSYSFKVLALVKRGLEAAFMQRLVDPSNPIPSEGDEGWPAQRNTTLWESAAILLEWTPPPKKRAASATVPKVAQDRNRKSR